MSQRKYELELWSGNNIAVGEVSDFRRNLQWSATRNAAEQISFSLDLDEFERYCKRIGDSPRNVLEPYVTSVKLKINGVYVMGTEVNAAPPTLADRNTIDVSANGYLNMLLDRYVTKEYGAKDAAGNIITASNIESTDIARDLIAVTQAKPYGDFGITLGTNQYNTGVTRYRNYSDQQVRDGIVNLTNLVDGAFDFSFTHDRQFETWQQIGSTRTDVDLTYPGNIKGGTIIRQASGTLYNSIIGVGSGFGTEALRSVNTDAASATKYRLREGLMTYSDISDPGTLDAHVGGDLALHKQLLELPTIKLASGTIDLSVVGVGDRIPVHVRGYNFIDSVNGLFRIEKIEVAVDKNDNEDITLTVDNYGL